MSSDEEMDVLQDIVDEDEDLSKSRALQGIENIILSFLTQLADASNPNQHISTAGPKPTAQQRRAKARVQIQLVNRNNQREDTRMRSLTYPRKCPAGSVRPLAQLLRVLDLAHEAIIEGVPMTKRDVFYNDVQLFKSQKTVDSLIDDVAATLDLDRSDLNIRASSKGLICGSGLTIHLVSGESIRATDTEGTLIPVGEDIQSFALDEHVRWVLIVEKEAVFQTLCRFRIVNHQEIPGRGLIITGKGYPDIATRHLVKTLAVSLPLRIPIMALVDADPYGLDILSVYNYGSRAMQHENDRLAAGGRVKWLGILASEFSRLGLEKDSLLPISRADEKKAYAMLQKPANVLPAEWKKELVHMVHSRRKAEIEILSTLDLVNRDDHNKLFLLHPDQRPSATLAAETVMHVDVDNEEQCQELRESHEGSSMEVGETVKAGDSASSTSTSTFMERQTLDVPMIDAPIAPCLTIQNRNAPTQGRLRSGLFWYLRKKIAQLVGECTYAS